MKYREFLLPVDFLPLLGSGFLAQGETLVVHTASETFTSSYDVPGRAEVPKDYGEGGKPTVRVVVSSPSPTGFAVDVADALGSGTSGIVLTNFRFAAFKLVPADPDLKMPTFLDGIKDIGRTLMRKEELPPYPMACQTFLEIPADRASYLGVHKEKPKNCARAKYHKIAFTDGSTIGLLGK